jgi:SulP family sulfate permease
VSVEHISPDGGALRLRVMGAGTVVGEMSVYRGSTAIATVTACQPTTIFFLSLADLGRLEAERPDLALKVHRYVAQLLGERLARANETVQTMLE